MCLYAILPLLYPESTPLYSRIGMCYPKGRVFAPFWSESSIDFAHFGLESGMVFLAFVCLKLHANGNNFESICQKPNEKTRKKLSVIREVTTLFQLLICQISAAGCLGV